MADLNTLKAGLDASIDAAINTNQYNVVSNLLTVRAAIAEIQGTSTNSSDSNLYLAVLNAPDKLETIAYQDPTTGDRRVSSIKISSASLGIAFIDAITYAGTPASATAGSGYYVSAITRTQTTP